MQDRRGRDFVQDRRGDIVQDENGTIREGPAPRKQQTGADQRQMLFWEAPGGPLGRTSPRPSGAWGGHARVLPSGPAPRGGHARVLPKPTPKKGRRGGSPFWRPCGPHNMRVQKVARDGVKYDTLRRPRKRLQSGNLFWKPPGARKIRVQKGARDSVKYDTLRAPPKRLQSGSAF